jgi:predicted kinase
VSSTLWVLCGPPGAGKTTWTEANPVAGRVVCSTERLRTDRKLRSREGGLVAYLAGLRTKAQRALWLGSDVLVDGCNTRAGDRSTWLRIARECNASTHLVVFHTPLPTLLQVQIARGRDGADANKVRTYYQEWQRALVAVRTEGWGSTTHVRRTDNGTGNVVVDMGTEYKRVSKW